MNSKHPGITTYHYERCVMKYWAMKGSIESLNSRGNVFEDDSSPTKRMSKQISPKQQIDNKQEARKTRDKTSITLWYSNSSSSTQTPNYRNRMSTTQNSVSAETWSIAFPFSSWNFTRLWVCCRTNLIDDRLSLQSVPIQTTYADSGYSLKSE